MDRQTGAQSDIAVTFHWRTSTTVGALQSGWTRKCQDGDRASRGGFVRGRLSKWGAIVAGQQCSAATADACGMSAWERAALPQRTCVNR
jgi:hypothetical protein